MEETIELREIINILLRGKWIIAIITVAALLIGFVFSWFVVEEKYQSTAQVQIENGGQALTELQAVLTELQATKGTFYATIKSELSNNLLQKRLNNPATYTNEEVANGLGNVSITLDTADPSYTLLNYTYTANSAQQAFEQLEQTLVEAKKELGALVLESLEQEIADYSDEKDLIAKEYGTLLDEYSQLIQQNNLPQYLLFETISSSSVLEDMPDLSNLNAEVLTQVTYLKNELDVKQRQHHEITLAYEQLVTGAEGFEFDRYFKVVEEPKLNEAPISPNKMLNLAIALVLGIMLSVGIVFFREYWRNSSKV